MASWLFRANPKQPNDKKNKNGFPGYRTIDAFTELPNHELDWENSTNLPVKVNDIVYIYVTAPASQIQVKAIVTKENTLLERIDDEKYQLKDGLDEAWYASQTVAETFRLKLFAFPTHPENLKFKDLTALGLQVIRSGSLNDTQVNAIEQQF